ncbi:FAD/NAD(P)-binding domain-containing protein [Roridomyces roridus]|uniref:FAD/NAD(P)-binding domain-containing protein n=1 Tax=Roridomyces roridus TaxID=1738132 RepID=A0AAD7CI40_9AGAR|nr:FAD/NAD(P)-binding domain-containing protein [Roridomyces roridus]
MAHTHEVASPRPLQVSIVGAGLGGLTAAIALRRSGHNVQVFESAEIKREIGAGITVQSSAVRVLRHLGVRVMSLRGVEYDGMARFDARTGLGQVHSWGVHKAEGSLPLACHRSDLHDELGHLATAGEGEGTPVQLHLGSKVVVCDPDAGSITLANGETIAADVVVGADGIHSTIRSSIMGRPVQPLACGISCFRLLLDASGLDDIPDLGWYTENPHANKAIVWTGSESFRMIFTYPVRDWTLINLVGSFADEDQEQPDWVPSATRQEVLDKFHDAHPKFLRLLDLPIVSPISKWKLRTVPALPTWVRGRAVLLGDSAHATVPFMGQGMYMHSYLYLPRGAAMALEDAGALGALLPLGTTKDEVPARLAAYETLRKERGEIVNQQSLARASNQSGPPFQGQELQTFLFGYDAVQVAQEYFSTHFSGGAGVV